MRRALLTFLSCVLFALPAAADPITVGFSTTGAGPFAFQADTFSLAGLAGSLTLDTASLTTANINSATFTAGDSGSFNGSTTLSLTYNLTLGGVTQALTQMATWTITPTLDTFITVAGSSPVLFNTAVGSWNVTLNGHSFAATSLGQQTQPTSANFAPVPEPGTLALLGTGLLTLGGLLRKRRQAHP